MSSRNKGKKNNQGVDFNNGSSAGGAQGGTGVNQGENSNVENQRRIQPRFLERVVGFTKVKCKLKFLIIRGRKKQNCGKQTEEKVRRAETNEENRLKFEGNRNKTKGNGNTFEEDGYQCEEITNKLDTLIQGIQNKKNVSNKFKLKL